MKISDILIGCTAFGFSFCVLNSKINTAKYNNCAASSDDCFSYTSYKVNEYFRNKYGNSVSVSENSSGKILLNVDNFSQTALNNYYNNKKNDGSDNDVNNSCTMVACLGLANYYGNTCGEFYFGNTSDAFIKIYDSCLEKGYTTVNSGTSKSKVNNCVTQSFSTLNSDRKGNTNWWNLYDNLNESIRENRNPLIFDLTNHSTVACGITSYNYSYTETYTTGILWWKKTQQRTVNGSEEFIIVNEGWGRYTKSLIPKEKITNATSGMQVCYAEK